MKPDNIKRMKVSKLMSLDRRILATITLSPSDTVAKYHSVAIANPYGLALVVDNDKLVGIVAKTDLAKAASVQTDPQSSLDDQPIVNKNFVKVDETDTVEYLIATLVSKDLDHIVVTSKDNKPVGMVDRFKLANEIEKLGT